MNFELNKAPDSRVFPQPLDPDSPIPPADVNVFEDLTADPRPAAARVILEV